MRKFVSEYNNGKYRAGCTGGTVIVIDDSNDEVIDKIKLPYCYCGAFIPGRNIFIAKSTAGYLLKYDIDNKTATRIRPSSLTQDGGFAVCPWDGRFYNIEMTKTGYQISIYGIDSFKSEMTVPIKGDVNNVLEIEFDEETHLWYVSLDYTFKGRVKEAIAQMSGYDCVDYKSIDHDRFNHAEGYKYWERCDFSEESGSIAAMSSDKYQIPVSLAELYNV